MHATMKELLDTVFTMWSMPRLYSKNHQKKVSHELEIDSHESEVRVSGCIALLDATTKQ